MESCSWCHTMVRADARSCPHCSHDAHVARADCKCYQCTCFPEAVVAEQRRKAEARR